MSSLAPDVFDPRTDLQLEREVDVSPAAVWAAWTMPEHLVHWFCPAPWRTTDCTIDLRPGGAFRTTMQGPDGEVFHNVGCYLEVVPQERLAWTNALEPGFRPAAPPSDPQPTHFFFTGIISLRPTPGGGTVYTARVLHANEADREKHDAMGFRDGWATALDQLVAHMKQVATR